MMRMVNNAMSWACLNLASMPMSDDILLVIFFLIILIVFIIFFAIRNFFSKLLEAFL